MLRIFMNVMILFVMFTSFSTSQVEAKSSLLTDSVTEENALSNSSSNETNETNKLVQPQNVLYKSSNPEQSIENENRKLQSDSISSSIDETKSVKSTSEIFNNMLQTQTFPYKDVKKGHWAYKEIVTFINNDYWLNNKEPYFKPNYAVTRAEAAVAIARSLNMDTDCVGDIKFADVQSGDPYYNAVCQLTNAKVIENGTNYYPNKKITRADFIKMIALAYDIDVDSVNDKAFKDITNHPLKNYIQSLADINIVSGVNEHQFAPERHVTRAQLAIIICRAIEFQEALNNHEMIYDFLKKDYIETINDSAEWSKEVIKLVNEERQKANLPLLQEDPQLSQIAVIKAQDFINSHYFEHESILYGQPWDLAALFDYEFMTLGENIAKNYHSPKEVVAAWMESAGHRENILRPQYTNIGVAFKKSTDGNFYWVQMFSSK
ncbi:CAP domain-containing protein [Ureibacillus massiliensis]|nr:CAP domain-containing protein [Ureibacillus massiliensis]